MSGGQPCSVCVSPQREAVEDALAQGLAARGIARRYKLSEDAVFRHNRDHLPALLRKGFEAREIARAKTIIARINVLLVETCDILEAAREGTQAVDCPVCEAHFDVKTNGVRDRVAAAGQVGKTLELAGRVTGEILSGSLVELLASLGLSSLEELKRAVEMSRSGESVTMEECRDHGLELVNFALDEHPEWLDSVLASLVGRRRLLSAAVIAEGAANGTNGGPHDGARPPGDPPAPGAP